MGLTEQGTARSGARLWRRSLLAPLAALAAAIFAAPAVARAPDTPFDLPRLPSGPAAAGRVEARFMGASTILLDDGTTQILVDGFFSRPGFWRTAFGGIEPIDTRIREAMDRARIGGRLRTVLVAQSHYDHALDSARIVRWTPDARLAGSRSTAYLGLGEGLPESRIDIFEDRDPPLVYGDFRITWYRSPHSPKALFMGPIDAPLRPPAHARRWREGGNYSFLIRHRGFSILVHPSANFTAGLFRRHNVKADVVFLAIGGLGRENERFACNYWREVVQATEARLVIPVHWDSFFRPLTQALRPTPWPADNVPRAMGWVRRFAADDGVALGFMPLFEAVDIGAHVPPRAPAEPRMECAS